jgi:hypothetical protein
LPSDADLSGQAREAYIFAFPLLLSARALAAPNRLFVLPGSPGTLRIAGWLDLRAEPRVLAVPETRGRYYVLWLRDAWNTAFASVGARTTGTHARAFAILGPGRHSEHLRPDLSPIAAPTRIAHVTGCIEAAGAPGAELLEGFRTAALSCWRGVDDGTPATFADTDPSAATDPVAQVERLDGPAFLAEAIRLSADNPPELADREPLRRLRALGGAAPDALTAGAGRGRAAVRAAAARPAGEPVGHWRVSYDPGRYGTDYLRRAAASRVGLGAEPATDELPAVLDADADGRPLTGRARYLLRFAADAVPPVNAFWSLATSAGSTGDLQGLKLDADGSLPIHIQHGAPEPGRSCNWLPAPEDRFSVVLRLYWPREEALQRHWAPPAVTRLS